MKDHLTRRAEATPRVSLKGGRLFWQPSARLRRDGWQGQRLGPLSAQALNAADELNASADAHLLAATADRPAQATLAAILDDYTREALPGLAASTRREMGRHLRLARAEMGSRLADQITAAQVEEWVAKMGGGRAAINAAGSLRTALGWAVRKERCRSNGAAAAGLGHKGRRRRIATRDELWAMIRAAEALGRPSIAAYALTGAATMQREGDLLALDRAQISAGVLRLTQAKTGRALSFRLHPLAAARLDLRPGTSGPLFVSETTGTGYGARAFQRAWAAVRLAAAKDTPSLLGTDPAVVEPNHQGPLAAGDLRRTGMVWAAEGGAGVPDICSVSGHTIDEGYEILEHYLPRHRLLADRAISRLDLTHTPQLEEIGARILAA